jgi:pyruvate/2-oxoglutarate dehydrogenase complex dihydrolipoamide dehydrogenase (E3) component
MHATAKWLEVPGAILTTETGEMTEVEFSKALISVATRPHCPDTVLFDQQRIFDIDEILYMRTTPRSPSQ